MCAAQRKRAPHVRMNSHDAAARGSERGIASYSCAPHAAADTSAARGQCSTMRRRE
jgi:hypothetical protein